MIWKWFILMCLALAGAGLAAAASDGAALITVTGSKLSGSDWTVTCSLADGGQASAIQWTLDGQLLDKSAITVNGSEIRIALNQLRDGAHELNGWASGADGIKTPLVRRAVNTGPFDWSQAVIYFVITDRFFDGDAENNKDVDLTAKGTYHGGDLKGLTAKLDYLADLGINALWITPILDNIDYPVFGAGFPDWGYHGYWAANFDKMDEHVGALEDMKALVSKAHDLGIRVLLDVVVNHCGYNARWTNDREWVRSSELGTCGQDDLTTCISGLPDFRTEKPEVAEFLISAQVKWAEETGVDGFRLDTVKHVEPTVWKELRKRIRATNPAFFMIGEHWGADVPTLQAYFADDVMDSGFEFAFGPSALGFLSGRGRTVAFDRYLQSRHQVPAGYYVSQYLDSHDVPGFLFQAEGDKRKLANAAVLLLTTLGQPMIYYGNEVGRPGGDWPDNRSDMLWGDAQDAQLLEHFRRLVFARRAHPSLTSGTHRAISTEGDVYVFARELADASDAAVVAVNRGAAPISVSIDLPQPLAGMSTVLEVTSGKQWPVADGKLTADLPAATAWCFVAPISAVL